MNYIIHNKNFLLIIINILLLSSCAPYETKSPNAKINYFIGWENEHTIIVDAYGKPDPKIKHNEVRISGSASIDAHNNAVLKIINELVAYYCFENRSNNIDVVKRIIEKRYLNQIKNGTIIYSSRDENFLYYIIYKVKINNLKSEVKKITG